MLDGREIRRSTGLAVDWSSGMREMEVSRMRFKFLFWVTFAKQRLVSHFRLPSRRMANSRIVCIYTHTHTYICVYIVLMENIRLRATS